MTRRPALFSGGQVKDGLGIVVGVAEVDVERIEIGEWGKEELESLIDEALQDLEENASEAGCGAVTDVKIELGMYRLLRGLIKIIVIVYGTCIGKESEDNG